MKTSVKTLVIVLVAALLSSCDYMGDEFIVKEKIVVRVDTVYANECKIDSLWEGSYKLESVTKGTPPENLSIIKSSESFYTLANETIGIELSYESVKMLQGNAECDISAVGPVYVYRQINGKQTESGPVDLFVVDVSQLPGNCEGFSATYTRQ